MKHTFEFLTITIEEEYIALEMTENQRRNAKENDLFDEEDKGYIECMYELFEDAHVDDYFHWWDGINNPLGLTEAPYISTQQGWDEESDTFFAAGRIYYFPHYQTISELEMLKKGQTVLYKKLED